MPIKYDDAGRVKRPGKKIQFDEAMLSNYANCVRDLKYFATNYYYIVHPVTGSQLINLRDYQHRILDSFANERFTCLLSARQVGKCVHIDSIIEILNEETGIVSKIQIVDFLKMCEEDCNPSTFPEITIELPKTYKKFTKVIDVPKIYKIKTPSGFKSLKTVMETVPYDVWHLELSNGDFLDCADTHIVYKENHTSVYVEDLKVGDLVETDTGYYPVTQIYKKAVPPENMYDVEVDSDDHEYYANGITSHNTTCMAIYILWFCCFQKDKTVAIVANKANTAKSILDEVKYAYEFLPDYIKPGAVEYNAHSVEFDNGCKIIARATTPDCLRGESISLLACDEFAFLPRNIADAFWQSNFPTISTGGRCIIVSTPNGTGNLFYDIYKAANDKKSPFNAVTVNWWEVPGRDEQWRDDTIRAIGKVRFAQEYGCLKNDQKVKIKNKYTGEEEEITIGELYERLILLDGHNYLLKTSYGWDDFYTINKLPEKVDIYKLVTATNKEIKCSLEHEFFDEHMQTVKLIDVIPGLTQIKTVEGVEIVDDIQDINDNDYVYDVIHVDNENHSYYSNGVLSHNCAFQGSSVTLIEADYIVHHLKKEDPFAQPDEWTEVWKPAIKGHIYVLSVDIGGGIGSDYSVINIFDITGFEEGHAAEQVGLWRCNTIPPTKLPEYIFNSAKYWNYGYVIIEVNPGGFGDDVCKQLMEDFEYENVFYDIERGGYGVMSTKTTKPLACQLFKKDLEAGKIIIHSSQTIDEIGYFEEVGKNVYRAKKGVGLHDDCVISSVWLCYFLHSTFYDGELEDIKKKRTAEGKYPDTWQKLMIQQQKQKEEQYEKIVNKESRNVETEEDEDMSDLFDAFIHADSEDNDPESWLIDEERRDYYRRRG